MITCRSAGRVIRPRARAAAALLLLLAGCGYQLAGTRTEVPGGIRTVSVGAIENRSREFGLDQALAFAFEREIYHRGVLRVEEEPGAGEAVLSGTIRSFTVKPIAFDEEDEALQYEAELVVDVSLRRQSDGVVLWQATGLRETDEYSVAARVVVPSTSQFQRGTLDVADLRRLTDIQLAETEKRLAINRLVTAVVQDVHDRLLDDF